MFAPEEFVNLTIVFYPTPDVFSPVWFSILTDFSHFNRLGVAILGKTNCCVVINL